MATALPIIAGAVALGIWVGSSVAASEELKHVQLQAETQTVTKPMSASPAAAHPPPATGAAPQGGVTPTAAQQPLPAKPGDYAASAQTAAPSQTSQPNVTETAPKPAGLGKAGSLVPPPTSAAKKAVTSKAVTYAPAKKASSTGPGAPVMAPVAPGGSVSKSPAATPAAVPGTATAPTPAPAAISKGRNVPTPTPMPLRIPTPPIPAPPAPPTPAAPAARLPAPAAPVLSKSPGEPTAKTGKHAGPAVPARAPVAPSGSVSKSSAATTSAGPGTAPPPAPSPAETSTGTRAPTPTSMTPPVPAAPTPPTPPAAPSPPKPAVAPTPPTPAAPPTPPTPAAPAVPAALAPAKSPGASTVQAPAAAPHKATGAAPSAPVVKRPADVHAGPEQNKAAETKSPEDKGRHGWQLSPHRYTRSAYDDALGLEEKCPSNSICKLDSFIVFDEFIGREMNGANAQDMRIVYKQMLNDAIFRPNASGYCPLRRLDGVADDSITSLVKNSIDSIRLITWHKPEPGHAVSVWRSPTTNLVYFCNSGDEAARQGKPSADVQLNDSPYSMVNGIVQFEGVSSATWDRFCKILDKQAVDSGPMTFCLLVAMLAYDVQSVTTELFQHAFPRATSLIGTFQNPHTGRKVTTRAFPYPGQLIGNCAFRATLLGLMAVYIDAVPRAMEHVPLMSLYVTEHVYRVFLHRATLYLINGQKHRDAHGGHVFEADELELITQRTINQRQHYDAVRRKAQEHVAHHRDLRDNNALRFHPTEAEDRLWGAVAQTRVYLATRHSHDTRPSSALPRGAAPHHVCRWTAGKVTNSKAFELTASEAALTNKYTVDDLLMFLQKFRDDALRKSTAKFAIAKFHRMAYTWWTRTWVPEAGVKRTKDEAYEHAVRLEKAFRLWSELARLPYGLLGQPKSDSDSPGRNNRDGILPAIYLYAAFESLVLQVCAGAVYKKDSLPHVKLSLPDSMEDACFFDFRMDCVHGDMEMVDSATRVMSQCAFGSRPGAIWDLFTTVADLWRQDPTRTKENYWVVQNAVIDWKVYEERAKRFNNYQTPQARWNKLAPTLLTMRNTFADPGVDFFFSMIDHHVITLSVEERKIENGPPQVASQKNLHDMLVLVEQLERCTFDFDGLEASTDPLLLSYGPNVMPGTGDNQICTYYGSRLEARSDQKHMLTNVHTLKRCIEDRYIRARGLPPESMQLTVESRIRSYLTRLSSLVETLAPLAFARAYHGVCYLWLLLGFTDTRAMAAMLFGDFKDLTERFLCGEFVPSCEESHPLYSEHICTVLKKAEDGGTDFLQAWERAENPSDIHDKKRFADVFQNLRDNDHLIRKHAADVDMYLMPFMNGERLRDYLDTNLHRMLDPWRGSCAFAHLLYSNLMRDRFLAYLEKKSPHDVPRCNALSYTDSQGNKKDALATNDVLHTDVDFTSSIFDTVPEQSFDIVRQGNQLVYAKPLVTRGPFTRQFVWQSVKGKTGMPTGFYGVPKQETVLKYVQYCVYVDSSGKLSKCPANKNLIKGRADKEALVGCACSSNPKHAPFLIDTDYLAKCDLGLKLMQRVRQFASLEDVACWYVPATASVAERIEVELVPYNVTFVLSPVGMLDAKLSAGALLALQTMDGSHVVCDYGCDWTDTMDNCFLVHKAGEGYSVVVFEGVRQYQLARREHRFADVFRNVKHNDMKPGASVCNVCHKIPIHRTGLTLLPRSYDAMWAYVLSCRVYNRTYLGMRVMPMLHALEDTVCQEDGPFEANSDADADADRYDTLTPFRCDATDQVLRRPWRFESNYPGQCESMMLWHHVGIRDMRRSTKTFGESAPFKSTGVIQGIVYRLVAKEGQAVRDRDLKTNNITEQLIKHGSVWAESFYSVRTRHSTHFASLHTPTPRSSPLPAATPSTCETLSGMPLTHKALIERMAVPITLDDLKRAKPQLHAAADLTIDLKHTPSLAWMPPTLSPMQRWCFGSVKGIPSHIAMLIRLSGSFEKADAFLTAAAAHGVTIRIAHVMYLVCKWAIPRENQLDTVGKVLRDLRGETASVHSMVMGSGKTAIVTPMVLAEAFLAMLQRPPDNSEVITLVLPPKLVRQSAMLLAVEFRPHTSVYVCRHCDWRTDPPRGSVAVSDDITVKRQLTRRAEQRKPAAASPPAAHRHWKDVPHEVRRGSPEPHGPLEPQKGLFVFDEVDSLVNPLTSELNVPHACTKDKTICEPAVDLPTLFRAVYRAVQMLAVQVHGAKNWADTVAQAPVQLPLNLPDKGLQNRLQKEFQDTVKSTQALRNRQHYGVVSIRDFQVRGEKAVSAALPFTFAETPAFGSKFSSIMFSMVVTAISYVAMDKLEAARAMDMVTKMRERVEVPPGCNAPLVFPPEFGWCDTLLTKRLDGRHLGKTLLTLTASDVAAIIARNETSPPQSLAPGVANLLWNNPSEAFSKLSPTHARLNASQTSKNRMLVDAYAVLVAAEDFNLETVMCNVSGIEMLLSHHAPRRSGFTGTPESLDSEKYDLKGRAIAFPRTPPAPTAPVGLLESPVWVYKDDFLASDGYSALRAHMKSVGGKNVRVIIDAGCETLGADLLGVFKKVCAADVALGGNSSAAKMLYWDADTSAPMLRTHHGDAPWDGKDDGAMSVYYRHANITGIDAQLQRGTLGVITIGHGLRYRDFAQALYRLRKIDVAENDPEEPVFHRCVLALPRAIADAIAGAGATPTREQIIAWMGKNDAKYNITQRLSIKGQCLRGILRAQPGAHAAHGSNAFDVWNSDAVAPNIKDVARSWMDTLVRTCERSSPTANLIEWITKLGRESFVDAVANPGGPQDAAATSLEQQKEVQTEEKRGFDRERAVSKYDGKNKYTFEEFVALKEPPFRSTGVHIDGRQVQLYRSPYAAANVEDHNERDMYAFAVGNNGKVVLVGLLVPREAARIAAYTLRCERTGQWPPAMSATHWLITNVGTTRVGKARDGLICMHGAPGDLMRKMESALEKVALKLVGH